jgi:hypothetical protein
MVTSKNVFTDKFKPYFFCCTALIFFLTVPLVFSQEKHLIQRITWVHEEYASRYELTAEERNESGTYTEIERIFTGNNFIEFSLDPGFYRYRIRAYDLLDRPSGDPPWIYVVQPELSEVSPNQIYADEDAVISISGSHFDTDARVYLQSQSTGFVISPEEFALLDNTGTLTFSAAQAPEEICGIYDVYIQNPGGLSSFLGPVEIIPRPAVTEETPPVEAEKTRPDFFLQAGYSPLIPVYGALYELLDTRIFPLGLEARLGFVPFKWGTVTLGFETAVYWNYIKSRYKEESYTYDVYGQMAALNVYGLLQKRLPDINGIFNFRVGGGLYSLLDFYKESSNGRDDSITVFSPSLNAGISFQWFFSRPFFLEPGLEYSHHFSVDDPSPGYLRPVLGIGLQL